MQSNLIENIPGATKSTTDAFPDLHFALYMGKVKGGIWVIYDFIFYRTHTVID